VCRRYLLDDRTKWESAAELGISCFKVARALRPEDVLGIAWGSTLEATASALEVEGSPALNCMNTATMEKGQRGHGPALEARHRLNHHRSSR
jgi:hypothetical protein